MSEPPSELEHAARHIAAALAEWRAGRTEQAAMHLREAIADAAWSLYAAWADAHAPSLDS